MDTWGLRRGWAAPQLSPRQGGPGARVLGLGGLACSVGRRSLSSPCSPLLLWHARTRTHVFVTVRRRSAHLQGLRPSRRSARGPQETGRPRGALRDLTAFRLVLMAEASLQMKVLSARTLTSPPLKR